MGSQYAYIACQASTQTFELPEAPDLGSAGSGRARVRTGGVPCDGCVPLADLQALLTAMLAGAQADRRYARGQYMQARAAVALPEGPKVSFWDAQLQIHEARVAALQAIEGELLGQVRC